MLHQCHMEQVVQHHACVSRARHAIPVSGGFDEEEIFGLAETLQNVHMFAAPTMVKRLTTF